MQSMILLLALAFFGQDISCNDELFSKLNQHAYKLKDVRMELMSWNRSYFNICELKAFKYNRTTTAHNITMNMKVDASDDIEVVAQSYKFLSNEYRHFPVRAQVNVKKGFKTNAIGFRTAFKRCGNVTAVDFHKDVTYFACNFMLDETKFPPLMPTGKFNLELTFLFANKEVAMVNIYHEIYIPFVYPK